MKPLPKLSIAPMSMTGYVLLQWQEGEGVTGLRSIQVPEHVGRGILALQRLPDVARGCHDYGGGYRDTKEAEVFHHGIQTVNNAIEATLAAGDKLTDHQVNALERIGRAAGQEIAP